MPGILPMKVIKVGSSSQSRIAQACDRCRSKKIRCDGIRPTCTQCANVGFECRTSDKLSRRAFPRGYTESLEERVRVLEAEVRDLKDLLDEKDEKIDMLSKMHGNHNHRRLSEGPSASSSMSPMSSPMMENGPGREATPPKEDTFRIQASPLLLGVENSDSYYMGPSSGRGFIEALKRRLQEAGKPCSDFNTESFLHMQGCCPLVAQHANIVMLTPPRLFSDRCVNIYFQEWAPLFPILHKPTFLRIYEDWVADPEKVKGHHKLAQLYLVFAVAALSSENPDLEQIAACEQQWQRSLQAVLMDDTMETLQCLVLALTYCQIRADYKRLQHYKCLAVGLSHRLGLHQSQKRFSFGALTIETRKKVFWALYTLDCFSAATLGLPKLIKEDDVYAEYPNDIDDEYVTEKGFLPTLPGESTRLSGALALFRASRILARVLEKNYPAATSHELSLQQLSGLEDELDDWSNNLPQHLKLTFKQDKPSTDITGSRSPLLAIAYYYIRTLIYRPAVGSSLGPKAAPAVMSISESSKHTIQIAQLLEERSLSFSFCLNKSDLLVSCGMALLYQSLELKQDSKMMKDNDRLVNAVLNIVGRMKVHSTHDFTRIASLVVNVDEPPPQSLPTPPGQSPDGSVAAPLPQASPASRPKQRHSISRNQPQQYSLGRHPSVSETDLLLQQEKLKRLAMLKTSPVPGTERPQPQAQRPASRGSLDSGRPNPASFMQRRDQRLSVPQSAMMARAAPSQKIPMDYLPMGNGVPQSRVSQNHQQRGLSPTASAPAQQPFYTSVQVPQKASTSGGMSASEWEALLGQIDAGQANLYDAIYGGPQVTLETPVSSAVEGSNWSPDALDLSTFNLGDFGAPHGESLSEESLSSASGGDDMAPLDFRDFSVGHHGTMMPADGFVLDGLPTDGSFGL